MLNLEIETNAIVDEFDQRVTKWKSHMASQIYNIPEAFLHRRNAKPMGRLWANAF